MSGNRSVQAAQRRRAGPTSDSNSNSNKIPQTSINSAQIFANQSRTTSSRLGGQQENMQQQQNQSQVQGNDKLSSVSKMTIPQAITLITLRLGSVESKMMQMNENISSNNMSGISDGEGLNIESAVFQSMVSRLESLEKRSVSTSGGASTPELNSLKQQFDTLKQAVIQTKGSNNSLVKENILLKSQIEELKLQILEMTDSVDTLRKLTYENCQNLLNISISSSEYSSNFDEKNMIIIDNFDEESKNEIKQENQSEENDNDELSDNQSYDNDQNNIIGTDLKKLIESELSFNA